MPPGRARADGPIISNQADLTVDADGQRKRHLEGKSKLARRRCRWPRFRTNAWPVFLSGFCFSTNRQLRYDRSLPGAPRCNSSAGFNRLHHPAPEQSRPQAFYGNASAMARPAPSSEMTPWAKPIHSFAQAGGVIVAVSCKRLAPPTQHVSLLLYM